MLQVVGGVPFAYTLLPLLEILLTVEETTVREAATASTLQLATQLTSFLNSDNDNDENQPIFTEQWNALADMVTRLATKEWFTARISAAALLPVVHPHLATTEQRKQHLHLLDQLCRDETPMVRRGAARHLGAMLHKAANNHESWTEDGLVATIFVPLYETLAGSDQPDSVRLQTTENCVAFGQVLTLLLLQEEEDGKEKTDGGSPDNNHNNYPATLRPSEQTLLQRVLPLMVATIDDRSWRVRWTAAAKFADVVRAFDQLPDTLDSLVPAFEKLLQDPEAEVRTAATFNLAHVARCPTTARVLAIPTGNHNNNNNNNSRSNPEPPRVTVAERLVKRVTSLTEDDSEHVRAALAMVATELAPVLGKDATITYLVPPVLLLLRDAASEVRLNLISSLSALNEVIGVDLLSQSLLPAILDLAQDGKWRIRLAIIEHIPLLAKQLGREFFTEKLVALSVHWLGDSIAQIRLAAATNMRELTALFGTEWALEHLLPSIVDICSNRSYLRRLTALQACARMATVMELEAVRLEMLPVLTDLAADIVPNIRFNVAKELRAVAPVCGKAVYEAQIAPILALLLEDDDRDVRFYAQQASRELEEEFARSSSSRALTAK